LNKRIHKYIQMNSELLGLHGRKYPATKTKLMNLLTRPTLVSAKPEETLNTSSIQFHPVTVLDGYHQAKAYDIYRYCMVLHGCLVDGNKATVLIKGIEPYICIEVDPRISGTGDQIGRTGDQIGRSSRLVHAFAENLIKYLTFDTKDLSRFQKATNDNYEKSQYWKVQPTRYEIVYAKPLYLYQQHQSTYIKIFFSKLNHRHDVIQYCKHRPLYTDPSTGIQVQLKLFRNEDKRTYYRTVARENDNIALADWMQFTNYKAFNGTHASYKGIVIEVHLDDIVRIERTRRPLIAWTWDIETYSSNRADASVPLEVHGSNVSCITMIGISISYIDSKDSLLRICLVHTDVINQHPDYLTITCKTEKELIHTYLRLLANIAPDFIIGFNDGGYDWPWLVDRASRYSIDIMSILDVKLDYSQPVKYRYKPKQIKITPQDSVSVVTLTLDNAINIDVQVEMKKVGKGKDPSYKLDFLLKLYGLPGKNEMSFVDMFDTYEEVVAIYNGRSVQNGHDVQNGLSASVVDKFTADAEYCVVDVIRTYELLYLHDIIASYIEMADVSYTSISDSFMFADISRVDSIVLRYAYIHGLMTSSNIHSRSEDYGGGYVFPPKRGLYAGCHDKSIIPNYVYAPEPRCTYTPESLYEKAMQVDLYDYETLTHAKKIGRPIIGLDYASLYPNVVNTYNLSHERIVLDRELKDELESNGLLLIQINADPPAWAVRHQDDQKEYGCLVEMFIVLRCTREELRKKQKAATDPFMRKLYNRKQLARKILMNSVYGAMGSGVSCIAMLIIAKAITALGQLATKTAYKIVTTLGCTVVYGDTDSLYIYVPEHHFRDVDASYYVDEIDTETYWTTMVQITFNESGPIRELVNSAIRVYSQSIFLEMAFEEVLFPAFFIGKKRYVGVEHKKIDDISFYLGEEEKDARLMAKGIINVRRDSTGCARKIMYDLYRTIFSIDFDGHIVQAVVNMLNTIKSTPNWFLDNFSIDELAKEYTYRPNKANICALAVVQRASENGIVIRPGEKFKAVQVASNSRSGTLKGNKYTKKKSDVYEHVDLVLRHRYPLDAEEYLSSLVSPLASFISYSPMFGGDFVKIDADLYTPLNEAAMKEARKYIEKYIYKVPRDSSIYKAIWGCMEEIIQIYLPIDPPTVERVANLYDAIVSNGIKKYISDLAKAVHAECKATAGSRYTNLHEIHRRELKLDNFLATHKQLNATITKIYAVRIERIQERLGVRVRKDYLTLFNDYEDALHALVDRCPGEYLDIIVDELLTDFVVIHKLVNVMRLLYREYASIYSALVYYYDHCTMLAYAKQIWYKR
jgi:DNA polymerase elongation subunit (family B)